MRRLLLAGLLACCGGVAVRAADSAARASSARLFVAHRPQGWSEGVAFDGATRYSDGRRSIGVIRYGMPGAPYATKAEFIRQAGAKRQGEVSVSGRRAERFVRSREFAARHDDGSRRSEWLYEELVVLPAQDGFWVLSFRSPSLMYTAEPEGLPAWRGFLKSFRLR